MMATPVRSVPVSAGYLAHLVGVAQQRHAGHALLEDFRAGLHGAGLGALRQYDVLYVSPGLGFDFLNRRHVLFLPDVLKYRGYICFQPI